MMIDLGGMLVLISGGCGSIGVDVCRALLASGARVAVNDVIAPAEAEQLLGKATPSYVYFQQDVTDERAVNTLFDEVVATFGSLPDAVLCHAGIVGVHSLTSYPADAFDELMRVNVRGAFLLAKAAAARWVAAEYKGHIIFTSSWCQDVPWPLIGPYNASKAAVRQLARSFARELAPKGIRANVLAAGIVAAGMAKRMWDEDEAYRQRAARAIPLGVMQPTESVANAFCFLLSPMASYMTGSTLLVDGGASLYPMDPTCD